ncbi:MAG: NAD(P)(+) transhydrogenase (Re/Si-specific) subunit beta, partial [Glaciecola sp.]
MVQDYNVLINFVYVVSAVLFIFGLKLLSHPATARKGNLLSALGMFVAVIVTLLDKNILSFELILAGIVVGSAIGVFTAKKIEMTAMPELVSLFNGIGGLASLAVAYATIVSAEQINVFILTVSVLALLIGAITFSGSVIAWAKLSERMIGRPIVFKGQVVFNAALIVAIVALSVLVVIQPSVATWHIVLIALALLMGVMFVLPIGGADMPVVISLLNSYSGLAACAAGFALENNLLIVAGSLVG